MGSGHTSNPRTYQRRQRAGVLIGRINLWALRLNVRPRPDSLSLVAAGEETALHFPSFVV
jgi:hypothetical protein